MSKIPSSRGTVPFAKLLVAGAAAISFSLAGVQSARAATYTWDPSITGGTSPGGNGTWNTSLTNWWDGTFDSAWGNTTSDVAAFGGSTGAVSVGTALNAGTLQFLTTGYTFTGSAITLGAGGIDASALSSGTTSIANAITLGAGQSWNIGTGASLLASGIISGTNSLAKTGAGTLTLSAVNTFSGGLTISQGTVSIAANNVLGGTGGTTGAVTLNGGTLKTTNTAALTNTHAITIGASGGALNITGSGASQAGRVITGANTLLGSGTLTINGNGAVDQAGGSGALVVTGANASFTGNIVLQNGGLLANEGGSYGSAATVTLSNNSELSTTNTLANAITVNGGTNSVLSFTNGAVGVYAGPITLNGDLTIAMRNWYNQTAQNGSITGTISGSNTIAVKSADANLGTGSTLTLGGFDAKASSAGIVLNGASLAINSNSGTAAASVTRANSLTINTGNVTITGVASQNTNDVFGTLNLGNGSAGNFQGYSTLTMTPNAATVAKLTFTNMGTRTAGSWVALAGTFGGTATTNMGNIYFTNALSSPNLIGSGGSLTSGTASVIPWLHDTGGNGVYGYDATVGVSAVTTLNVNPNSATAGQNINWNAASTLTADRTVNSLQMAFSGIDLGGHTLTVASGVITADNASFSNGTLNFGSAEGQLQVHNARTLSINSAIAGSGGLTYVGFRSSVDPSLILAGTNTYTGMTNFYGYGGNTNVRLTNSLALQNTTFNHVAGRGYTLTFGNGGTSGLTAYTFGGLSGNANLTLANNNTTVQGVALTVGGDGDSTTYSGVLSDSGTGGSLIKTGAGVLTLSGANTFNGGVSINGGKLNVAATETAGTSGPLGKAGTISFGGGTLQYSAANAFDYSSRFSTAASQAYSVDTNGRNVTWGTALTSSGGSLAKAGSGTLTLSAASTYTGSTSINAGTLLLSGAGSVSNSSVINVASGARFDVSGVTGGNYTIASGQTLNGKGTLVGNTTIAGNLAPGNSPGLLTFSNALTLSGTATMEINNTGAVRGTDYDGVDVGGLLTYGGALNLTMTSLISAGTYNLFDFGSVFGNLSSVAFAGGAYAGTFTYNSGNGTWNATDTNGSGQSFSFSLASGDVTVVPEPATYALLGMGLLIVVTFRRRLARCRE